MGIWAQTVQTHLIPSTRPWRWSVSEKKWRERGQRRLLDSVPAHWSPGNNVRRWSRSGSSQILVWVSLSLLVRSALRSFFSFFCCVGFCEFQQEHFFTAFIKAQCFYHASDYSSFLAVRHHSSHGSMTPNIKADNPRSSFLLHSVKCRTKAKDGAAALRPDEVVGLVSCCALLEKQS